MTKGQDPPSGLFIPRDHPLGQRPYFFNTGIRFECRQCGKCCTGEPGIVRVSEKEMEEICRFLDMDLGEFKSRYLQSVPGEYFIGEDPEGRCFFYENGCRIYSVRPLQCRRFPFWLKNFRSEKTFRSLEKECPGIGKGSLYSKEEILAILST